MIAIAMCFCGLEPQALEMARELGDVWMATTASPRNTEAVTNAGAHRVINYRKEKWWDVLAAEGLKSRVDVVYDTVGGAESWSVGERRQANATRRTNQPHLLTLMCSNVHT